MVHDKTGPDRKKLDRRNARQQPIKFKDSGFRTGKMLKKKIIYIYLPAGRSVLRKTVPEVLSTARGRKPRAVLKTEGTVFLNTDRPRPANNIFIFFLLFFKS